MCGSTPLVAYYSGNWIHWDVYLGTAVGLWAFPLRGGPLSGMEEFHGGGGGEGAVLTGDVHGMLGNVAASLWACAQAERDEV